MPIYKYKAINETGKSISGVIEADTSKNATDKLKRQGVYISSIDETREGKSRSFNPFKSINITELAITTRQFSTLISAGLPLEASLTALSEQTEDARLGQILTQVKDKISEGSSLAHALSEYDDVFSDLYVNIVKAGEASGTLDIVLMRLADFLEKQAALRARVKSALIYPLFMFVIGASVLLFTMTYIIPQISKIFEESDKALPLMTTILISTSSFLRSNILLIPIIVTGLGFAIYRFNNTKRGRMFFDRLALKVPVFGKINTMVIISRFTRTLGTLLSSGIPLLDALEIGEAIMGNAVYGEAMEQVRKDVREGTSLAQPLKDSGVFPPLVTRMIAVGEQTGEMEAMLTKVADIYDMQIETMVSALTSLLEPVMILVIGAVMGFIVFAVLMPIFNLTSTIG